MEEGSLKDALEYVVGLETDKPVQIEVEGHQFVYTRNNSGLLSVVDFENTLAPLRPTPRRTVAHPQFITVESFAEYFEAFAPDVAVGRGILVQGSIDKAEVRATLDYHAVDHPAWCDHTATLISKRTPEWVEFKAASGVHKSQKEFADFIDKWGAWVIDPVPTELIKIIEDLEGHTGGAWGSKVVRQNGAFRFSYTEETVTNITVPTKFVVQIQPFYSSAPIKIDVKLQYRVNKEGGITFAMILDNPLNVEYKCLMETFASVESLINTRVLVGP